MALDFNQLRKFQKTFERNTVIFKEGGEGNAIYILVKGSVSVLKGIKKVAELKEEGTWFGEMSPLLGKPRTATIVTNEVSIFIIIPPAALPSLINDMGMKLAKLLAERVDATTMNLVKIQDEKNALELRCRGEYQRLAKVIGCVYEATKFNQLKSVHEYAKKQSFLATGGYAPQMDEMHMDEFLKKTVGQFKHKVS